MLFMKRTIVAIVPVTEGCVERVGLDEAAREQDTHVCTEQVVMDRDVFPAVNHTDAFDHWCNSRICYLCEHAAQCFKHIHCVFGANHMLAGETSVSADEWCASDGYLVGD